MTLVLAAGCTTSSLPRHNHDHGAGVEDRQPPAALARFVALAHEGLREPFEAAFRHLPPEDRPDFSLWYEPTGAAREFQFRLDEAAFGHGTFRFIKNRSGDFECLLSLPPWRVEMRRFLRPAEYRAVPASRWVPASHLRCREHHRECDGPAHPVPQNRSRALPASRHPVRNYIPRLTRTGQLALATDMFVSGQLEAVSLRC